MKTVTYKGYQAAVEFEDGTLFVKILHISDLLIAECDKASEADGVAAMLIDDYLDACKELGKEPEQPFKGSFNVRMTPEIHKKAAMAAASEGASLNSWVNSAVFEKLECARLEERFDKVLSRRDHFAILADLQKAQAKVAVGYWSETFSQGVIEVVPHVEGSRSGNIYAMKAARSSYSRRRVHG